MKNGILFHFRFVFENNICISSVQSLSRVWPFATPWTAANQASLSITNSRSPPKLMCIKSVMPSSHLIVCRPLLLLPSNLSQHQGLFQWVSSSHQVAKVLEFQLQHQSFQCPGLISFRMDWLDLLAAQGTLKSLLQHHSSKTEYIDSSNWRKKMSLSIYQFGENLGNKHL